MSLDRRVRDTSLTPKHTASKMRLPTVHIGRRLPPVPPTERPDWQQADPRWIAQALERALERPAGGWMVIDASRRIGAEPARYVVRGQELVAWRAGGRPYVAPAECPHMGADLSAGRVEGDCLVCPWHGMRLHAKGYGRWKPLPTHDDGVLTWARIDDGQEATTEEPVLPTRPSRFVSGIVRMVGDCEPEDVLANRLDPWHGVHFHPHSFARLTVTDADPDRLALRVSYRAAGPVCVEVDCTFHCPDRRTVVMRITGGDGEGSVVETHVTPVAPGRTSVVEATLATSDRFGFGIARRVAPLLRPFIERRAARLWQDDLAYAERRYALRMRRGGNGARRSQGMAASRVSFD